MYVRAERNFPVFTCRPPSARGPLFGRPGCPSTGSLDFFFGISSRTRVFFLYHFSYSASPLLIGRLLPVIGNFLDGTGSGDGRGSATTETLWFSRAHEFGTCNAINVAAPPISMDDSAYQHIEKLLITWIIFLS